jgi:hypothetical protein
VFQLAIFKWGGFMTSFPTMYVALGQLNIFRGPQEYFFKSSISEENGFKYQNIHALENKAALLN